MKERIQKNILAGILAVIPVLVTFWIVELVLDLLIASGLPFVGALAGWVRPYSGELADLLLTTGFQSATAVVITLVLLYILGAFTTAVVGRRLLSLIDRFVERIPFVQMIYGATRKLIATFQYAPPGQQRVVLIEFPSPEMKAVGLVTRVFRTADTGREVAAVYVPTTPNPTSGYLEVVPVERLVWLDWTTNDAMQFIISGGTVAPDRINYGGPHTTPVDLKPPRAKEG
ncbi:MAG TPA: DUF502 domain-containing protein [Alphaproteobacteria bacterium]|nr:DUF502 domain-containing protein [Alphaproteobacteria bacterium]